MAHASVAVTIVKDTERKQALQMVGEAYEVALDDATRVDKLYSKKFGVKAERLQEVLANTADGRAYWVFKPSAISLWDEVNFPTAPKQEYSIGILD